MTTQDPPRRSLEELVVAAFAAARDSGKVDWRAMRVAVLKNRLLQLTNGTFAERDYGTGPFRSVVASLSGVVKLEGDAVTLISAAQDEDAARPRIRPDLWQAVMDYSSGERYVWDGTVQRAIPASNPRDERPILPTLTKPEFNSWRLEFAGTVGASEALEHWVREGLGTKELPAALRGKWNGFVRDKAMKRLEAWFQQHGIPSPELRDAPQHAAHPPSELEQLRELLKACAAVMTLEEAKGIHLPLSVVLRAGIAPSDA